MKIVIETSQFRRHYKERIAQNEPLCNAFQATLEALLQDPASVRRHGLTGKMSGKASFEIAPDCRVIYREQEDAVVLVDIGTHEQVYQR